MERLTAIVCTGEDGTTELCSPRVGTFRSTLVEGDAILPGRVLGELTVLRRRYEVVAPSDREMRDRMRDAKRTSGAPRLIINAHVDSMHRKVVTVWDAGNAAGFDQIEMRTMEEDY